MMKVKKYISRKCIPNIGAHDFWATAVWTPTVRRQAEDILTCSDAQNVQW